MDKLYPILTGVLVGCVLAATFFAGFFIRDILEPQIRVPIFSPSADTQSPGYPLLDEVQNLLNQVYLREQPDYTTRQYAAIRGVLSSLDDPNTFFIEPPVAQSESDVLAGTYGGVGVLVQRNELGEFVLYPFDGSPAQIANIPSGSILLAINSEVVDLTTSIDVVDQAMRGQVEEGNGVELTYQFEDNQQTVFIEYDVINVPSVIWRAIETDNRIGYIQIIRFTSRTPDELRLAIEELTSGENNIAELIVDLRGNSGGLLKESVEVADEFLDGGVVVYEVSQDDESAIMAESGGTATQIPLVVLVNNRSASASELVAGALRDRERAILIGQRTYGKGTVQQIFNLSDNSSIHITSAEWFTPSRTPLAGVGLEPNIEMIPDVNGRDVELGEAIRYLQDQRIP